MASFKCLLAFLLLGVATILALPVTETKRQDGCKTMKQRKAWHTMTDAEKKAYIDAELCIMSTPSRARLRGAQTLFDDFQSLHALQFELAHGVGSFLTWHRAMMWAHEYMLEKECGYTGGQPYWDQTHDSGRIFQSHIFDPVTGFGSNGVGTDRCIQDGPFANYTNHIGPGWVNTDHCIQRSLNNLFSLGAAKAEVSKCMGQPTYEKAWACIEGSPHGAGHGSIGAQMGNPLTSPGDPIFYLHHTWIDKLWWDWQALDLDTRLTEMAGRKKQAAGGGFGFGFDFVPGAGDGEASAPGSFAPPSSVIQPDFGDSGPPGDFSPPADGVGGPGFGGPSFGGFKRPDDLPAPEAKGDDGTWEVTLGHVNEMLGIVPDITTGEMMDIRLAPMCYIYVNADED